MKTSYLIPILLFLSAGCIPDNLGIEVAEAESKLVISSQVIPGNTMVVIVSRSFSALEGNDSLSTDLLDDILVEDAQVTITWETGSTLLTPLEDAAGIYISEEVLPEEARMLRLDVLDLSTGQEVYAETELLPAIQLDSISFTEVIEDNDTTQSIYYRFEDPEETENWYVINVFDAQEFIEDYTENPLAILDGNAGVVFETLITDQTLSSNLFEDEETLFDITESETLSFFFANISEGYFRFLDAQRRSGGIISSAASEPVNFPTNVVGGLGYFNAHNPRIAIVSKNQE